VLIIKYTRPKGLFHIIKYCEASPPPQGSFLCDAWRFLVLDIFHDSHLRGWLFFLTLFSFTARYEGGGRNVTLYSLYQYSSRIIYGTIRRSADLQVYRIPEECEADVFLKQAREALAALG
jgi:hypothetical protein